MKDKYHRERFKSESPSVQRRKQKKIKHQKHKYKHKKNYHHDEYQKYRSSHQHHKHDDVKQEYFEKGQVKREMGVEQQRQEEKQEQGQKKVQKELPNFEPSGILLEFYNSKNGVSLKFHEPQDAHMPTSQWRIYPFKNDEPLQPIILKESCYLVGKDERICDILCQNPSISRQHAVIQFRKKYKMQIDGKYIEEVKPYLIDLQSTNGTSMNDEKVQPTRYYEIIHRDMLKFGHSQRQYVFVHVQNQQQ